MLFLNAIRVSCANAYGRVATWKQEPASAIYSLGYGYEYSKTDD